jgi:hypothetical protein
MDLWLDPNLSPFMAVIAHWIEGVMEEMAHGSTLHLKLQSDLIGFPCVPGHHHGEHLAHVFLHITDHLKITAKVIDMLSLSCVGINILCQSRSAGLHLTTHQITICSCRPSKSFLSHVILYFAPWNNESSKLINCQFLYFSSSH